MASKQVLWEEAKEKCHVGDEEIKMTKEVEKKKEISMD